MDKMVFIGDKLIIQHKVINMALLKCFLLCALVGYLEAADHFKDVAKRIYIGTAMSQLYMNESENLRITAEEFNMITVEWELKWAHTEPERGKYTYELGDRVVAYANKHKMMLRGHNLIWHEEVPPWVNSLDKESLRQVLKARIINELTHYKGRMYSWDVVNEVFEWNGGIRKSIFYNFFGESYISDAFILARKIDPKTKLYINDYNIESNNSKSNDVYNLVKKMRAAGVPIDGVGFQAHFTVGNVPAEFEKVLQRFIDLGVEVAITELDVYIDGGVTEAKLKQQAEDYATVYKTCMKLKKCVGVTVWDWCDKYSYAKDRYADMWDVNIKPKPAVQAVLKALKG